MTINDLLNWYYSLENGKQCKLLDLNTNTEFSTNITKGQKGLEIKVSYPFFSLLYDDASKFIIFDQSYKLKINNFLPSSTTLFEERICNAYIFESIDFDSGQKGYFKYYSLIENSFIFSFLENQNKKMREFSIVIDDCKYTLRVDPFNFNKKKYLIIENDIKVDFTKFKHSVNIMIVCIGYLSGYYYRIEEFYFKCQQKDFEKNVKMFARIGNKKSLILEPFTDSPVTYYNSISNDLKQEYSSSINLKIFNDFIKLLHDKPRIYSAIINMFDIYKGYSLSIISMYFVILETICEEFKVEISKQKLEKTVLRKLGFEILEKIKDKIGKDEFNDLSEIIENVDESKVANNINFEEVFRGFGITISNSDKEVFKQRNKIFHGRIIPSNDLCNSEDEYYKIELKYDFYSYRLYVLISKLLLKRIGFKGYIINYPKVKQKDLQLSLGESYFLKV